MQRLGFIGTGTITAAMARGLKASDLRDWPVLLSPRNADVAAALAEGLPGVSVAADNQSVIDGSDIVVLAVLPQTAESIIRPLRFQPHQRIISLVAGLDIAVLRGWTAVDRVTRAIPMPFVEQRCGVTPILPPDEEAAGLFRALGGCIELATRSDFDGYAAASAMMSSYFGIAEIARDWLVAQGHDPRDAEFYFRNLFGSLGDILRASPQGFTELRTGHATRGGLNELVFATFTAAGGDAAIRKGLDAVMARLQGRPAS